MKDGSMAVLILGDLTATRQAGRPRQLPDGDGTDSGAVGSETAELARLLASLTPAQRAALLAMARGET